MLSSPNYCLLVELTVKVLATTFQNLAVPKATKAVLANHSMLVAT